MTYEDIVIYVINILGRATVRNGIHASVRISGLQDSPRTFITLSSPLRGATLSDIDVSLRAILHMVFIISLEVHVADPYVSNVPQGRLLFLMFCEVDPCFPCISRQNCILYVLRGRSFVFHIFPRGSKFLPLRCSTHICLWGLNPLLESAIAFEFMIPSLNCLLSLRSWFPPRDTVTLEVLIPYSRYLSA